MRHHSKPIHEHFEMYRKFISDEKLLESDRVILREHKTRNNRQGGVGVVYSEIDGGKRFEAEISYGDRRKYKLRIFADRFGNAPCFRFDSFGRAHCNPEEGFGLLARQVLTPHFHRFNDHGDEIAFHSGLLKNPKEADKIINDPALGVQHFCQEANLKCDKKAYPELVVHQGEMDLSIDDRLNGVSF